MVNSLSILIRYTNNKFVSVCSFYANSKPSAWLPVINCSHFTLPVVNERHAFQCKNVPVSEIVYVKIIISFCNYHFICTPFGVIRNCN